MLNQLIKKEFIRTKVVAEDWKDAIYQGMFPLLKSNLITKGYEKAILKNFEKHGTYMVIAPGIVLSHARPEDGVIKQCMSVINLKTPVKFGHETNDPVSLIITLAAQDNTSHLDALSELMEILMEEDKLNALMYSDNISELEQILLK